LIPWVVLVGKDEMKNNELSVKNMHTGDQQSLKTNDFIDLLKS